MKVKETAAKYQASKKFFTYQDYQNLPDDDFRYQLIEGELVMAPAPKIVHQMVKREIEFNLNNFIKDKKIGELLDAPCDVYFDEHNVFQPDILFISKEKLDIITEDNIKGAPDLIVEILSPSSAYYDLIVKKEIYEKSGVKEYWIVDPMRQWIEIHILEQRKFKLRQRLEKQGVLKSSVLKDFKLDIKKIFKS